MDQIKILVTSEYENERVDKVIASEADTLSRKKEKKIRDPHTFGSLF